MLENVWRIEINPCPPSRAASWRLTVRGQGVSAVSWEGEEEEEEEEGVSEPGAGREADSEFPGPQLLPPSHPILQCPPPAPLTSTQRGQRGQQALLELISLCRTLERQSKLAVTQAPMMEDGVHFVVNQAWLQGTLQGGLRGRRGSGQIPPSSHARDFLSTLRLSAYLSIPQTSFVNPRCTPEPGPTPQYHSPILLSTPLTPQYFPQTP